VAQAIRPAKPAAARDLLFCFRLKVIRSEDLARAHRGFDRVASIPTTG
jgi:hypothetical protein